MADPISAKTYANFQGVDLSTPYELRIPEAAERLKNGYFLKSGAVTARPGNKFRASALHGLGYDKYIREVDGETVKTRCIVGLNLQEILEGSFAISKAQTLTSPNSVVIQFLPDEATETWKLQIIEDGTQVALIDVGVGVDETFTTLADLETAVEAISADWSVTITGDSSQAAAFLPMLVNQSFTGTDPKVYTIPFDYPSEVREPAGAADMFEGIHADRHSDSLRNATFLNHHNVLLIATEQAELRKWDGQMVYRAGMPLASVTSVTPTGGGSVTATWNYRVRYVHTDSRGNYIPGALSDFYEASMSSNVSADLVIPTIQDDSGFATDIAVVDGNQSGVNTLTVDSGHTFVAGDKVSFFDRSASDTRAITRNVVSVTATTIVIDGATVDVDDNDVISHGLVIEVYRTLDGGTRFYLDAIIPNDSSNASVTYVDTTTDANLGELLFAPTRPLDPPPKGGVIVSYQGSPVMTRNPEDANKIYWAESLYPEGFPAAENYQNVYSPVGGSIVSIFPTSSELIVAYETAMMRIIGTLYDDTYEIRDIARSVGVTNHDTFSMMENGLVCWLSFQGPMQMLPGGSPEPLGRQIEPVFTEKRLSDDRVFRLRRAISINDPIERIVWFYLPTESTIAGERFANDNTEVWALNYQRQDLPRWMGPWTGLNMSGGAIVEDGQISFVSRRYDTDVSAVTAVVQKSLNRGDEYDQVNHNKAIDFDWAPSFESAGDEDTKKIFEYIKVNSNEIQRVSGFTLSIFFEKNHIRGVSHVNGLQLAIGSGGASAGWGFAPWGLFPWGMPTPSSFTHKIPVPNEARSLRPTFMHSKMLERPVITSYRMKIVPAYMPGRGR